MVIKLWEKIKSNSPKKSNASCCKVEIKEVPQSDGCCSQTQSK